jgi:YfiH family protein
VRINRRRAAEALGFETVVFPRQVHGSRVVAVEDARPAAPDEADALVTDRPGTLLGVLGADCPGVLLAHPARRALAVVHAGWRGVAAGVVEAAVGELARRYGAQPDGLLAAVGPAISAPRYEVSTEVAERVVRALEGAGSEHVRRTVLAGRPGHVHVDLSAAIRGQLERAGVPAERIEVHGGCTFGEPERWFSHRRDGERTGRHALLAGWRE